ncbi:MAG: cytochrome ubiquinol oxidase subunit I [bacterium]|nr:cytochrome ubiquinol oxidase subunit I [bacterium]
MYPIWEFPSLSAGFVIAIIATFHILPSHLSVSSMWFNVYMETKAYRENRPELLEFPKKFTKMLLIFSYVFGSLTGVGIWFAISVAAPRGTSALIHTFVWGWATEWVFFLVEIAGIFIYYYTFDKIDRKTHLIIGWIFALGSWITMLIITGILAFQLTPGIWPETGKFFDGFFNPTYWPQALTRITLMFAIGGVFVIAVASRLKNLEVQRVINRIASLWGLIGLVLTWMLAWWYYKQWPETAVTNAKLVIPGGLIKGMTIPVVLLLVYFLYVRFKPTAVKLGPALVMVLVLFIAIWSGERSREIVRKPYVVNQYMYSNQFIGKDAPGKGVKAETASLDQQGVLQAVPFVPVDLRTINDSNRLKAGVGNEAERAALAAYLVSLKP